MLFKHSWFFAAFAGASRFFHNGTLSLTASHRQKRNSIESEIRIWQECRVERDAIEPVPDRFIIKPCSLLADESQTI